MASAAQLHGRGGLPHRVQAQQEQHCFAAKARVHVGQLPADSEEKVKSNRRRTSVKALVVRNVGQPVERFVQQMRFVAREGVVQRTEWRRPRVALLQRRCSEKGPRRMLVVVGVFAVYHLSCCV
jgi:hypothetical protein